MVTYNRYREHFNATGLRFGKLVTDSCATCDRLVCLIKQMDDETEKEELQKEHREHLKEADMSYKMRTHDWEKAMEEETDPEDLPVSLRSIKGVQATCSDFMGNIQIPKLTAGEAFYKRKLKLFCYGIHLASLDQHQMYFWSEHEGKKTNNDILSVIHACLTDRATGHEALRLWNDNTTAQVKGWGTVRYLTDLAHPDGLHYYTRIDNMYPPVGHTYLENDRGFATISRAARKVKTIPSCGEYIKVAQKASWSNPAHCVVFGQDKHRDVSEYLVQFYHAVGSYRNTEGDKVYLDRIRWFNYGVGENAEGQLEAHPNEVWYRETFDQTQPWKKFSVARGQFVSHTRPLSDDRFDLYQQPLPIDRLKAKDLFDLSRKFLTAEYHTLYPAPVEESEDESSSSSSSTDSSDDEEEKASKSGAMDITDIDDGSMLVYDVDESTIGVGQVLAVDEK